MDELNTRLRSCFFQFSSVCAFSGRPMAEHACGGRWRRQRPPPKRAASSYTLQVCTLARRTHHRASRRGDRDAFTSEIWTAPTLTRLQARSTFRWISMTHLLQCGQTPCVSPTSHWFARGAEFAWRRPEHGASEHRYAPSRCVSVSDDQGRPLTLSGLNTGLWTRCARTTPTASWRRSPSFLHQRCPALVWSHTTPFEVPPPRRARTSSCCRRTRLCTHEALYASATDSVPSVVTQPPAATHLSSAARAALSVLGVYTQPPAATHLSSAAHAALSVLGQTAQG